MPISFDVPLPPDEEARRAQARAMRSGSSFLPRFLANLAFEQARDVSGLAQGLTSDPLNQMGRAIQQRRLIVEPTPEEAERAKRGLAALGGLAVPGPISKLVGKMAPGRPLLRALTAGASGGATDAAIRTGGDPAAMAGGAAFGGGLGAAFHAISPKNVTLENPLESTRRSMEAQGPPGREIAEKITRMQNRANVNAGTVVHAYTEAGLDRLTPTDDAAAGLALRGKLDPSMLTDKARRIYDLAKAHFRSVADRAQRDQMTVNTPEGRVPFKARENYFPQHAPELKQLERGPVRDDALANAVAMGTHPNKAAAAQALDSWIEFVKNGGQRGGDRYAQAMARREGISVEQARGRMLRFLSRPHSEKFGNLERAREFDFEFYDPSPKRTLGRYAENAERRLASVEHLGQDLEELGGPMGRITDPEQARTMEYLTRAAVGAQRMGDQRTRGLLGLMRQASTTKLSPTSAVKNLGQTLNTLMATDIGSTAGGIKDVFTKAGRGFAEEAGATTEGAMRHSQHMIGAESSALRNYLRAIGFTASEKGNRAIAANAGRRYGEKMMRKLAKNPNDQFAQAELSRLQLDPRGTVPTDLGEGSGAAFAKSFPELFEQVKRRELMPGEAVHRGLGMGTIAEPATFAQMERELAAHAGVPVERVTGLTGPEQRYAGQAITDRSQFNATAMDLPPTIQDSPIFWSMAQYKTYPYQQAQMLRREIVDRWNSGIPGDRQRALRNAGILAAAFPAMGEVINDTVEGLKATGGAAFESFEEGRLPSGAELGQVGGAFLGQTRKAPPWSPQRYVENAVAPGALGILGDVGGAIQRNPLEYAAGPSLGTASRLAQIVAKGAGGDRPLSNADARYLYRQIPTVGPLTVNTALPVEERKTKPRKERKARKEKSR